ncbi:MAG: methionyl-tRNA formyltransferase [Solobacterium sp.]|nr:methionyl-tRNA formyltransferase [Solobacterium sp.]
MVHTRIVFFGTSEYAAEMLKELSALGYEIAAAVSQPDKPVGRKRILEKTPVHAAADTLGIPVIAPEHLKEQIDDVLAYEPELIVTCAYGQFVPQAILSYPKYGCLNIHPSLLPKYRGGAPIHYAILNGDRETGVCLMEMVKKMDAGRVFACRRLAIGDDETLQELSVRLIEASRLLLREDLPKYLAGELPGTEQDEDNVVIARNISPEEEKVVFAEEDVTKAYNHIRAMIDWPVSHGVIEGKRIRFLKARKTLEEHEMVPGTVAGFENKAMKIAAKGGFIHIYELQPEGKKPMPASAFANGAGRTLIGKVFD